MKPWPLGILVVSYDSLLGLHEIFIKRAVNFVNVPTHHIVLWLLRKMSVGCTHCLLLFALTDCQFCLRFEALSSNY